MKKIILAVGALLMAVLPVRAADLAVPIAPSPPVVAAAHDWAGAYIGVFGGWHSGSWALSQYDGRTVGGGFVGDENQRSNAGWTIGGDAGYNWQTGSYVLGVEGDIAWNNAVVTPWGFSFDACGCATTDTPWIGTLRGRAGFAFDNFLLYGTAGVAAGQIHYDYSDGPTGSEDHLGIGWAAGLGGEVAITDNISAKIEYIHVDLGAPTFFSGVGGFESTVAAKADTVRAGLNFKF